MPVKINTEGSMVAYMIIHYIHKIFLNIEEICTRIISVIMSKALLIIYL